MNALVARLTKRLKISDMTFRQAVFVGFIIAIGLEFIIYPFEKRISFLLMQLVVGVGFLGIVLNVTIMLLTDLITKILPKHLDRERVFGLIMRAHLPLTLGLVIGIFRIWYPGLSAKVCLMLLEGISLAILTMQLTKVAKRQ